MNRRELIAGMGTPALARATVHAPAQPGARQGSSSSPPRKVIVGTAMQQFWVKHPGLEKRLDQLTAIVDGMRAESQRKYGRGLDLAILPETAVSGEAGNDAMACAVPFDGPFANAFSRKAKELGCYVIAPTYLRESERTCSNAAVLFGRRGRIGRHLPEGASGALRRRQEHGERFDAGQSSAGVRLRFWKAGHPDLLRHGV